MLKVYFLLNANPDYSSITDMKFGVVGSGPCGALAALILLQNGFDVDLIEIDNRDQINRNDLNTELKLNNGDSSTYDMNQLLKIQVDGSPATFYRSKVLGGFSGVWGATWESNCAIEEPSWNEHYRVATSFMRSTLNSSTKKLLPSVETDFECDCLSFIEKSSSFELDKVRKTDLAIAYGKCGCVTEGKNFCNHGSIWSSLSIVEECMNFEGFQLILGRDVKSISILEGLEIESTDNSTSKYDFVILASGPLGISEILLNSFEEIQEIRLSETRMGYAPFFKYNIDSGHKGAFAFSKYRLDLKNSQQEVLAHVQLYPHSELYLDRIKGKLPRFLRFLSGIFISALSPHMGISLFYINSKMSESLTISIDKSLRQLNIETVKPKIDGHHLKGLIRLKLKELGVKQLLPSFMMAKVGESYHLGAAEELLDEFGFLRIDGRIAVAGSFALPEIAPGPITHAAMAQTSRLVEKIIHQNLESI
jgi:hypothetical protein